jgi:decaprenylphospho-beta-D-ribofuranose 2-oxidase
LTSLLEAIAADGAGSFLAVLKRFGLQDSGFAFPMAGYTLALDFPIALGTLSLLERLDQITVRHHGRFYLAKDARMVAETLRAADPRVGAFIHCRDEKGWSRRFRSSQMERLST